MWLPWSPSPSPGRPALTSPSRGTLRGVTIAVGRSVIQATKTSASAGGVAWWANRTEAWRKESCRPTAPRTPAWLTTPFRQISSTVSSRTNTNLDPLVASEVAPALPVPRELYYKYAQKHLVRILGKCGLQVTDIGCRVGTIVELCKGDGAHGCSAGVESGGDTCSRYIDSLFGTWVCSQRISPGVLP
jgi:hypothetical protein